MKEPIVYLNGDFVPASRAAIRIYDLGIILGATLTEMTRTFAHAPFRLDDHLDRLYRSCKYAGIHPGLTRDDMRDRTHELIQANGALIEPGADLGIVHPTSSPRVKMKSTPAAPPPAYVSRQQSVSTPFRFPSASGAISSRPAPTWSRRPCATSRPSVWIRNPRTGPACTGGWPTGRPTRSDPEAITLLLDLDGNITECAGSNFVIVSDRTVYSPTTRNILQGVSLLTVKELASELGLGWIEKDLQPYDVANADEAWLTTTPYCIAPCTKFNNIPVGSGEPGTLFREIITAWSNRVGLDVESQILRS